MERYTDHINEYYATFLPEVDEEVALKRFAEYEDIGKEPKEIQEILDKDNRLISEYAEENARLKRQLAEVTKAAKTVHDATIELDAVINL